MVDEGSGKPIKEDTSGVGISKYSGDVRAVYGLAAAIAAVVCPSPAQDVPKEEAAVTESVAAQLRRELKCRSRGKRLAFT
jgi:hypothetical protein